jgi:putative cell wall-binding protein
LEAIVTAATSRLRRRGIGAGVSALVGLSSVVGLAAAAHAAPGFTFPETNRVAGADRYATAIAASTKAFPTGTQAGGVVLVSGSSTVDGLTASYVAGLHTAPILLVKNGVVDAATLAEITRLNVKDVYIVGGTTVVPEGVETQLDGKTITRFGGADRYETASRAATNNNNVTTQPGKVFIASGTADALAAAPVLYNKKYPLLLTRAASVPATTSDALGKLTTTNRTVLGGTTAVEGGTYTSLGGTARIDGANRFETAAKIAASAVANEGFSGANVAVANGNDVAAVDSLTGSVVAGKNGVPLIFTNGTDANPAATTAYLTTNNAALTGQLYVFGGTTVVSAAAATAVVTTTTGAVPSSITVSPSDAVVLTLADEAGKTPTADDRTYTASGLSADLKYRVTLVNSDNITTTNGVTSFEELGTTGVADPGALDADITVVNGVPTGAPTTDTQSVGGIVPSNGSISFRVDGSADETLVPVVYVDGGTDTRLQLNAAGVPTEVFALGGAINYNPAEAAAGDDITVPAVVTEADVATNSFVADGSSFTYDANDLFTVDGDQATLAEFEAALQADDTMVVGDYQQNEALVSTFALTNTTAADPVIASVDTGESTATVNLTGLEDDASATVYYAETTTPGAPVAFDADTFTAVDTAKDADATENGFQATVTGLDADTEYTFYATQTTDRGETGESNGVVESTTETAGDVTLTSATVNEVNNGAGSSKEIRLTFSEDVTVISANGDDFSVNPTNQAALNLDVASAAVDPNNDRVVVLTLTDALDDTTPDIGYTVTVDAGAVNETSTGTAPNAELKGTFNY